MKKIFGLALAIGFASTVAYAQTTYNVDTKKSTLDWLGKKVTGQHNGTVDIKEGSLTTKKGIITAGTFTIDMQAIKCLDLTDKTYNQKLVGHLESKDFFNVAEHPTAKLVIKSVTDKQVTADLTIKGITNEIKFPVTVKETASEIIADASFKVDRSKYDVRYGSSSFFDSLGDKVIYDDIEFTVHIEGKK